MAYVHLVIGLALLEFVLFGYGVARARILYKVPAPAMSGHEVFDRYFRAQMNTLEQLVVFLPSSSSAGRCISAATCRRPSRATPGSCSPPFRT